jgi:hypothetical protein
VIDSETFDSPGGRILAKKSAFVQYPVVLQIGGLLRKENGDERKVLKIQIGDPDPGRICTSIVERRNLSIRTSVRRLTRLTNGFSKKWENLRAALALYFAYDNFCRIHSSIRCTPAMESGLTQHVWTLRDLLAA